MPKTDKGKSSKDISEPSPSDSDAVEGRYPTEEEWASTLERARAMKQKHDGLFRRLAREGE